MTPREVLASIQAAGLRVTLDGDALIVSPGSRLTPDHRELIAEHKPLLLELLRVEALAVAFLDAIGETDQAERQSYLERIENNPQWIPDLERAAAALGIHQHQEIPIG